MHGSLGIIEDLGKRLAQIVRNFNLLPRPPEPVWPSPFFDRFCIAFLAADWVIFGSMHFSLHDKTVQMLPSCMPFRNAVVICTGVAEVTVGILMLYGRTRRIAGLGSLFLLLVLLPAVFYMLYN